MVTLHDMRRAAGNVRVFIGKGVPYWHHYSSRPTVGPKTDPAFSLLSIPETLPGCQQFSRLQAHETEN
jgi:hypothetical protein